MKKFALILAVLLSVAIVGSDAYANGGGFFARSFSGRARRQNVVVKEKVIVNEVQVQKVQRVQVNKVRVNRVNRVHVNRVRPARVSVNVNAGHAHSYGYGYGNVNAAAVYVQAVPVYQQSYVAVQAADDCYSGGGNAAGGFHAQVEVQADGCASFFGY